jgi:5-methylcytosine-specific restriction endonuclease McrA
VRSRQVRRKGYAASRVAYDRRRRSVKLDALGRQFAELVKRDPCAFCDGSRHEQMAADHIEPLELGGEQSWENLTGACRACNAEKKNKRLLLFLAERPVREAR